jgi:hypothetical protein
MTEGAESDQVIFRVMPASTSKLHMMDLQVLEASTILASKSISSEHLLMQVLVRVLGEPAPR